MQESKYNNSEQSIIVSQESNEATSDTVLGKEINLARLELKLRTGEEISIIQNPTEGDIKPIPLTDADLANANRSVFERQVSIESSSVAAKGDSKELAKKTVVQKLNLVGAFVAAGVSGLGMAGLVAASEGYIDAKAIGTKELLLLNLAIGKFYFEAIIAIIKKEVPFKYLDETKRDQLEKDLYKIISNRHFETQSVEIISLQKDFLDRYDLPANIFDKVLEDRKRFELSNPRTPQIPQSKK